MSSSGALGNAGVEMGEISARGALGTAGGRAGEVSDRSSSACTLLREGSVCITRQCQVVFKHNRKCLFHLAPCPTGLRSRRRNKPCSVGNISFKPRL